MVGIGLETSRELEVHSPWRERLAGTRLGRLKFQAKSLDLLLRALESYGRF